MRGEAEEFDVEAPPPARLPRPAPAPRPVRAGIGWFIAGLILVGTGVFLTPTIGMTDRHIAPDLSATPQLQWEVSLDSTRASDGDVWIDSGHVVTASSNAVRGVDLGSGDLVWEVRAPELTCARDSADIACVSRQGTRTELIELTAGDGETGRSVQPDLVAALPHDGDTFAVFEGTETISVARWGGGGQHVWTHRTAIGDFGEDAAPGRSDMSMVVADDALLVTRDGLPRPDFGQIALGIDDGTPRADFTSFAQQDREWLMVHNDSAWVVGQSGRSWPLGLTLSPLRIDDDPGADAVFDQIAGGMLARSHEDHKELWEFYPADAGDGAAAGDPVVPHARLDDTVVAWADDTLYGLAADDGTLVWQQDSAEPRCPCLGNGRTLAHVTGSEESVLTGIDVASGQHIWQVPISEARTVRHATDGDHLAVYTAFGLSLWSLR